MADKRYDIRAFFSVLTLLGGVIVIILADQALKYKTRLNGGFYICNENISFGLPVYPIIFWLILVLFLVLFSFYFNYLIKKGLLEPIYIIAFIFLLGGSMSNALDRLLLGCVMDFLSIGLTFLPIFNPADVAISLGGFLFFMIIVLKKE